MGRGIVIGLVFALVGLAHTAWAVERIAASCNRSDVQATISVSANGDTVIIPAGSCTWTNFVSMNGLSIKLRGAGTPPSQGASGDVTITVNNADGSVYAFLFVTESTAGHAEVSNLTFVQGTNLAQCCIWNTTYNPSGGNSVLVHHNTFVFHRPNGSAIFTSGTRGVFYRNKFLNDVPTAATGNLNSTAAIRVAPNVDNAKRFWNAPSTLGALDTSGENNLYFETNWIENFTNETYDGGNGSRFVVRFNTFVDSAGSNHGIDSTVGNRQMEIYNNTHVYTDRGSNSANIPQWVGLRGGTGVITDNIFPSILYGPRTGAPTLGYHILRKAGFGCYNKGYPGPHQPGWGWTSGSNVLATDGVTLQALDPYYNWNNRVSVGGALASPMVASNFSPNGCGSTAPDIREYVLEGRDFYNEIARPGYTKYPYPHPLTESPSLAAPSGLQVR